MLFIHLLTVIKSVLEIRRGQNQRQNRHDYGEGNFIHSERNREEILTKAVIKYVIVEQRDSGRQDE